MVVVVLLTADLRARLILTGRGCSGTEKGHRKIQETREKSSNEPLDDVAVGKARGPLGD